MLEANENKLLRILVCKTKINRIGSQKIRESRGIQPNNEWMERRRKEWDEHVTRMDAKRLVKILRNNIPAEGDLQEALKEDGLTYIGKVECFRPSLQPI